MAETIIPLSAVDSNGGISACHACAGECHYHCCKQQLPAQGEKADPSNSLLLYPGEWAQQPAARRQHILITDSGQDGSQFGFCDPQRIDQSQCHSLKNFKPLDCKSYPFFPAFVNGALVLLKDSRCPLTPENEPYLDKHYQDVLMAWQQLIADNPQVAAWLLTLELPEYEVYVSAQSKKADHD